MRSIKKKAFTLIELLVVIAIIALLLAIITPALSKAKQQAERVMCKSNLHSYGLAGIMYLDDNGGKFPNPWTGLYNRDPIQKSYIEPTFTSLGESNRNCRWHNAKFGFEELARSHPEYLGPFWPYLSMANTHVCPTFRKLAKSRGQEHGDGHIATIPIDPQYSYTQNAFLGQDEFAGTLGGVIKLAHVAAPARTFYFAEENMWQRELLDENDAPKGVFKAAINDTILLSTQAAGQATEGGDCFSTYHVPPQNNYDKGSGNAVMLDGSVITVTADDVFRLAWPKR